MSPRRRHRRAPRSRDRKPTMSPRRSQTLALTTLLHTMPLMLKKKAPAPETADTPSESDVNAMPDARLQSAADISDASADSEGARWLSHSEGAALGGRATGSDDSLAPSSTANDSALDTIDEEVDEEVPGTPPVAEVVELGMGEEEAMGEEAAGERAAAAARGSAPTATRPPPTRHALSLSACPRALSPPARASRRRRRRDAVRARGDP